MNLGVYFSRWSCFGLSIQTSETQDDKPRCSTDRGVSHTVRNIIVRISQKTPAQLFHIDIKDNEPEEPAKVMQTVARKQGLKAWDRPG